MAQRAQSTRSNPAANLALPEAPVVAPVNYDSLLTKLDQLYLRAKEVYDAAYLANRPEPARDNPKPRLNAASHFKLRRLRAQFSHLVEDTSDAIDSINNLINDIPTPELNQIIKDKLGPIIYQLIDAVVLNPQYFSWTVNLSGALSDLFSSLGLYRDERRRDAPREIILRGEIQPASSNFDLYDKLLEAFGSCLEGGNYGSALAIRAFFPPDNPDRSTNERSRVDAIIRNQGDKLLFGLNFELAKLGGYLNSLGSVGRITQDHPLNREPIKAKLAAIESLANLLPDKGERPFALFNGTAELITSLIALDIRYGFNQEISLASDEFVGISTAIKVLRQLGSKEVSSLVLATALNEPLLMITVQEFMACCNRNLELAQDERIESSKISQVVADSFLADWLSEHMPVCRLASLPHSGIRYLKPRAKVGSNIGMLCENLAERNSDYDNLECINIAYIPFIKALLEANSANSNLPSIIKRVANEAETRDVSIFMVIKGITRECFKLESGADKASKATLYTSLQLLISGFISASSDIDILSMAEDLRSALEGSWTKGFFNAVHPGSWDGLKAGLDRFLTKDFNDAHTIRKAHRELLRTEFFSSLGVRVR